MAFSISQNNKKTKIKEKHNIKNNIKPITIKKEIRDLIYNEKIIEDKQEMETITKKEKEKIIKNLEEEMRKAAKELDFEKAMELRDILFELKLSK